MYVYVTNILEYGTLNLEDRKVKLFFHFQEELCSSLRSSFFSLFCMISYKSHQTHQWLFKNKPKVRDAEGIHVPLQPVLTERRVHPVYYLDVFYRRESGVFV